MSKIYERSLSSTISCAERVLDYYWCASPLGAITQDMFNTVMSAVYDAQGTSDDHKAVMLAINRDPVLLNKFGGASWSVAYIGEQGTTETFWADKRAAIIHSARAVSDSHPEALRILRSVGGTRHELARASKCIEAFIKKRHVGRIDLWLHDWPELAVLVEPQHMPRVMPKVVRKPKISPEERADMEWITPIIATAAICRAGGGHPKEYKL